MQDKLDISLSNKKLFRMMVIPSIIMFTVSGIMQLGDRIIGAFFIGENTLAILSLMSPILMFGVAFAVMVVAGMGIEINYLLGKKEKEKAYGLSTFVIVIVSILSIALMAIFLIFNKSIVNIMVPAHLSHSDAVTYLFWLALMFPPLAIGYTISTTITADGNGMFNMFGQITLATGNVIFNLIFVLLFDLGILGLGLGTFISALCFLWFNLGYYLFKINHSFRFGKIIVDFKEFGKILYNGSSEFLSIGAFAISSIVINATLLKYLDYQFFLAYSTLAIFLTLYMSAIHGGMMGGSPIISKAYGENNIDKIDSFTIYSYTRTLITTIILYVLASFVVTPLSKIFITESDTINTIKYLYWTFGAINILLINMIYGSGVLSAVKKPLLSLIITLAESLILVPVFVYLFVRFFGENGLIFGLLVAQVTLIPIVIITIYFTRKQIKKSINKEQLPLENIM